MMESLSEVKTWLWVPFYWIVIYTILLFGGIVVGHIAGTQFYSGVFLIGVPLLVIPITYKNLVGGGCSLRFQMCALVKGMIAGLLFMLLASAADHFVWSLLGGGLGWTPVEDMGVGTFIYQVWFISGAIGGMGARIVEVRGHPEGTESKITIAGFE
ncbi:MAG: hypothetical protein EAX95_10440 [Candidatus Thorarchaeota archaeon]|nr:hypothetical protein [Candidatus Thorarchaeota archaeon]